MMLLQSSEGIYILFSSPGVRARLRLERDEFDGFCNTSDPGFVHRGCAFYGCPFTTMSLRASPEAMLAAQPPLPGSPFLFWNSKLFVTWQLPPSGAQRFDL
jgi:hypothetical protein